jgi:hypothetical protein
MLEDALRYQMQGDDWLERVLIGGGALFLGFFLFIPLFTFNGYMLEVMRRVMDGETEAPPEWRDLDLVDTTVWGLKHAVVVIVFSMTVFLLAGVPLALIVGVGIAADSGALALLGVLVGGAIYTASSLVLAAVLPVATANFVRTDSIGAAFDRDVLRTVVPNRTMLMAVLYAVVANILVSVASSALGFTIVGYLAVPFVAFAGQSAIFYIWAGGFADAYEEAYGERPAVPEGPLKPGVTVGGTDTAGTVEAGSVTDGTAGTGVSSPDAGGDGSDWNDADDDRGWE